MKKLFFILLFASTLVSCKKYLDRVPDASLTVPKTVEDYRSLLDNTSNYLGNCAYLSEFATDEVYFPDQQLQSQGYLLRNAYVWADDIFNGQVSADWSTPYGRIYNANVILDGLKSISANSNDYNNVKGGALFLRAICHFSIAEMFAAPYDATTSKSMPGIPYKISPILTDPASRGTLNATYTNILSDLKESVNLVSSVFQTQYRNRPSKSAVFASLARVYLSMSDYENAYLCADSSLRYYNRLIDYNNLDLTLKTTFPITAIDEILCLSSGGRYLSNCPIDSNLYKSYDSFDLRKFAYFIYNNTFKIQQFKGSYNGFGNPFNGPAVDEVYLIKAETAVRLGHVEEGINLLNTLLSKRYKTGHFTPYIISSVKDPLLLILTERQKELVCRGLRWTDLRRLNQEGKYKKDISRTVAGILHILPYNSDRYVFPIPPDEIQRSGLQQNPR